MAKQRLTKKLVDSLKPREAIPGKECRYIVWDDQIAGFGVAISPISSPSSTGKKARGQKTFIFKYRGSGRQRKYKIGVFGSITVDQARKVAKKLSADIVQGKDPAGERSAQRKKDNGITVPELVSKYMEEYAKVKKRSWREDQRYLGKAANRWKKRTAASITKTDVRALFDFAKREAESKNGKGIAANRLLAAVRKMFAWAADEADLIPANPALNITVRLAPETPRERTLNTDEIRKLLTGLPRAKMSILSQLAIRLLLLTGQRTAEVLNAEWKEVDFKKKRWILPGSKTKNGKVHLVPLSKQAINIFSQARELSGGDFAFSTTDKPMVSTVLVRAVRRSEEQSPPVFGLEYWTVHDLRRTVVTGLNEMQIKPHVVERIVNHAVSGESKVAGTYNKYSYEPEKRAALKLWATHIDELEIAQRIEN